MNTVSGPSDNDGAASPKEQMRLALERKNAQRRGGEAHTEAARSTGTAHGPAAGKKQFTRRKAGG